MPVSRYDQELPEKSRALAEDPAGYLPLSELPPLPPIQRQRQQSASIFTPLLMLVGVFLLLTLLTTGILRTIDEPAETVDFPAASRPNSCAVIADQDVNVREGPGFDYARAWILPAGQARLASVRTDEQWYQVDNGWVLAEEIRFTSQMACAGLEVTDAPRIFDDEISLPDEVAALGWRLILNESFATNSNQWQDATAARTVVPMEGALGIASGMRVSPMLEQHTQPLGSAFYTFRVAWAASDPTASLIFAFQTSDAGSYWLEIKQNGTLTLWQVDAEGNPMLLNSIENYLPIQDDTEFTAGILTHEGQTRVFINDTPVLTAENTLLAGTYSFSLRGQGSVARINRLDVRVPQT